MKNIANEEKHLKQREQMYSYLIEKYKTNDIETYTSPISNYKLTVEHYLHIDGIVQHSYTRGVITNNGNDNKIEIIRNYGSFLFEWIIQAENEYLLCSQDYQGYTIVDLSKGEIIDCLPEEAYEGRGFCWARIHSLINQVVIAVEGCYWADEYEIVFYEISNILELPYKEIARVSPYGDVKGWKEPNCLEYYSEEMDLQEIRIY